MKLLKIRIVFTCTLQINLYDKQQQKINITGIYFPIQQIKTKDLFLRLKRTVYMQIKFWNVYTKEKSAEKKTKMFKY